MPQSIDSWFGKAKELNPQYSDAEIVDYYYKLYPSQAGKTSFEKDSWVQSAKEINPAYSTEEIESIFDHRYGFDRLKITDRGDFTRAWGNYIPHLRQMGSALEAAAGVGMSRLGFKETGREWLKSGLEGMEAAKSDQEVRKTDTLEGAWEEGGLGSIITDWLPYQAGQTAANFTEMAALIAAGAAVGGVAGSSVVGAGATLLGKKIVKKKILEKVAKIAREEGEDVAKQHLKKEIGKAARNIGITGAIGTGAVAHGYGEVASGMLQEMEEEGVSPEELKLGRLFVGGSLHAGAELFADKYILDLMKKPFKGKSFLGEASKDPKFIEKVTKASTLKRAVRGAGALVGGGMLVEGLTEPAQTAIERWASEQDLASKEAFKAYGESAAAGAVGGGMMAGGIGAVRGALQPSPKDIPPRQEEPPKPSPLPSEELSGKSVKQTDQENLESLLSSLGVDTADPVSSKIVETIQKQESFNAKLDSIMPVPKEQVSPPTPQPVSVTPPEMGPVITEEPTVSPAPVTEAVTGEPFVIPPSATTVTEEVPVTQVTEPTTEEIPVVSPEPKEGISSEVILDDVVERVKDMVDADYGGATPEAKKQFAGAVARKAYGLTFDRIISDPTILRDVISVKKTIDDAVVRAASAVVKTPVFRAARFIERTKDRVDQIAVAPTEDFVLQIEMDHRFDPYNTNDMRHLPVTEAATKRLAKIKKQRKAIKEEAVPPVVEGEIIQEEEAIDDRIRTRADTSKRSDRGLEETEAEDVRGTQSERDIEERGDRGDQEVLGREGRGPVERTAGRRGGSGTPSDTGAGRGDIDERPTGTVERDGEGEETAERLLLRSSDYRILEDLTPTGPVDRFNRNKAALELLQELEVRDEPPTDDEKAVLAAYTGWGALGQELFQGTFERTRTKGGWAERSAWLRKFLGKEVWESAQNSITNAHYTTPEVVSAIWSVVEKLGFKKGRVLEPALGVGNFFGLMPSEMRSRSTLRGVELDQTTGTIAKYLYPNADIRIQGFEEIQSPDDFYDLIIGNWPFKNVVVPDKKYQQFKPFLHDYFFLKAIDIARPGGLVIGITSAGTMDKKSANIRREMAKKAELVAAFRLNNEMFKGYAGTSVTTDLLILKKREKPVGIPQDAWLGVEQFEDSGMYVNAYYFEDAQYILGRLGLGHGTTSGRPGMLVTPTEEQEAYYKRILELAPEGIYEESKAPELSYISNHTDDREGAIVWVEEEFRVVRGHTLVSLSDVARPSVKKLLEVKKYRNQIKDLISIREAYGNLIEAEMNQEDAEPSRKKLNGLYASFKKSHGPINRSSGLRAFSLSGDPFYTTLASLETPIRQDEKIVGYKPAGILTESTIRKGLSTKDLSIVDSYIVARNSSTSPRLSEVAAISGKNEETVRAELVKSGAVFSLPNGDIIPSDMYLSGNAREKLKDVEGVEGFEANVKALKDALPAPIPYYDITVKLGATWLSLATYRGYVRHMLGNDSLSDRDISISFAGGQWRVRMSSRVKNLPSASVNYGSHHVSFEKLFQHAIASKKIVIKRKVEGADFVDQEATDEVNTKIERMQEDFSPWLLDSPESKMAVEKQYNQERNSWAKGVHDGSFMRFAGMALQLGTESFNLRKHQVDAIWAAIANKKSMNFHEVGTGKTFTIGGIAIESRRYGIAKKPILFAHNANSKAVAADIQGMYPAANILYIGDLPKKDVDIKLRQIANDDWDLIVVSHSLIGRFELSNETLQSLAQPELEAYEAAAREAAEADGVNLTDEMLNDPEETGKIQSFTAKEMVKARNRILSRIERQMNRSTRGNTIPFEDTGIDMILVDESHEFKKPPFATTMNIKGLNVKPSERSISLMLLTQYVRTTNNGGNIHLFTGTPITNTLAEIFHQMSYVMKEEMAEAGVDSWDGWFNSFADSTSDIELTAAGEYEVVDRLRAFINTPELYKMAGQYMSVVFAKDMPEMTPRETATGKILTDDLSAKEKSFLFNGRTENAIGLPYMETINITSGMSPQQTELFTQLQQHAREWRAMSGKERREANQSGDPRSPMIQDGIAEGASFDIRLLHKQELVGREGKVPDHSESKISKAIENVLKIYNSHPLAVQAVFYEKGVNKVAEEVTRFGDGSKAKRVVKVFSPVHDMVERLVAKGIPREEIAVITGSVSKLDREKIAAKARDGKIRIVFGSNTTLGVGVNIQKNLKAIHHLAAPWMPGMLLQRIGRIMRQGNQWNTVLEYRYLTDRLDGRRWQILLTKMKIVHDFLVGGATKRTVEEDSSNLSDFVQAFSDSAGDPRVLLREKFRKKLKQLQNKERQHTLGKQDLKLAVSTQEGSVRSRTSRLRDLEAALPQITQARDLLKEGFVGKIHGKEIVDRAEFDELLAKEQSERVGSVFSEERVFGEIAGIPLSMTGYESLLTYHVGDMNFPVSTPSSRALQMSFSKFGQRIPDTKALIAEAGSNVERFKKEIKAEFPHKEELTEAKDQFEDIEEDLANNPTPPPFWLRTGAPVGTDIWIYEGQTTVTGHRWTEEGYFVVTEDGDIPFNEALNEGGIRIYKEVEFVAPEVIERDTEEEGTEVVAASEELKKLNELVKKDLKGTMEFVEVEPAEDLSELLDVIKKVLGKRVIFVSPVDEQQGEFELGGAVLQSYPDVIFIQHGKLTKETGFLQVIGHEFGHTLKQTHPSLYKWLYERVIKDGMTAAGRKSYERKTSEERHGFIPDHTNLHEELLSDFIGDALADPVFLGDLAADNPSKFESLLRAALQFLAKIVDKATGFGSSVYFDDVEKMRGYLKQALEAHVSGEPIPATSGAGVKYMAFKRRDNGVAERLEEQLAFTSQTESRRTSHSSLQAKSKLRKIWDEWITPKGGLSEEAFEAKGRMEGFIGGEEVEVKYLSTALNRAFKAIYGVPYRNGPESIKKAIFERLSGRESAVELPESIADIVSGMRVHLDKLSSEVRRDVIRNISYKVGELSADNRAKAFSIIADWMGTDDKERGAIEKELKGLFSGKDGAYVINKLRLVEKIQSGYETYLNRSFQVFSNPKWEPSAEVVDAAKEHIRSLFREDTNLTEEEIESRTRGMIGSILGREGSKGIMGFLGQKNLSILWRRNENIDPTILALMGEMKDPLENYSRSATKMVDLIAKQRFLVEVRERLLGVTLSVGQSDSMSKKIKVRNDETYAPLSNLYGTEEFVKALDEAISPRQLDGFAKLYAVVNGAVKLGKVAIAPTTQMGNFISAFVGSIMNGHFDIRETVHATHVTYSDLHRDGTFKDYVKKLVRYKVLHSSVHGQETLDHLDDLIKSEEWAGGVKMGARRTVEFFTRMYQMGDDFWKVMGFEKEKALLMKHKGHSEEKAEIEAARRISLGYMSYWMSPKAIVKLRQNPLMGPFVTFQGELIRTIKGQIDILKEDYEAGDTALVQRRLIGIAIGASLMRMISHATMSALGMDDEDDEAERFFMPEWMKHSTFAYFVHDGERHKINLSRLDLYGQFQNVFNAVASGQTEGLEALVEPIKVFFEPYIATELTAKALMELHSNHPEGRRWKRIVEPDDSWWEAGVKRYNYLFGLYPMAEKTGRLMPGAASNVERLWKATIDKKNQSGKAYYLGDEIAGLMALRPYTSQPNIGLRVEGAKHRDMKSLSRSGLLKILRSKDPKAWKGVRDEWTSGKVTWNRAYKRLLRGITHARRLGHDNQEIRQYLLRAGVAKLDIQLLLRGVIPKYNFSRRTMSRVRNEILQIKDLGERKSSLYNFRKSINEMRKIEGDK